MLYLRLIFLTFSIVIFASPIVDDLRDDPDYQLDAEVFLTGSSDNGVETELAESGCASETSQINMSDDELFQKRSHLPKGVSCPTTPGTTSGTTSGTTPGTGTSTDSQAENSQPNTGPGSECPRGFLYTCGGPIVLKGYGIDVFNCEPGAYLFYFSTLFQGQDSSHAKTISLSNPTYLLRRITRRNRSTREFRTGGESCQILLPQQNDLWSKSNRGIPTERLCSNHYYLQDPFYIAQTCTRLPGKRLDEWLKALAYQWAQHPGIYKYHGP